MKIGIDLGTTNSAVAWMDPSDDDQTIHVLDIPQFVAQGREERLRTLPSFLYLGDQTYVGAYAREQGALTPTRSVHSAKSWLSNPDVDRTAKILPWDSQESARELSPVEVSAKYIGHMRKAWDAQNPEHPMDRQEIVLTVPASFDEEARELTVAAAREAGLEKITLLEEPAAAFYSWIANHLAESQKQLFDGQMVLVCDVGGGTSDFTLIRVGRTGDMVDFTRTAVGKHLLLGGDNLDLTLTWLVEAKLGKPLSLRQRSALRRQCASAKERMLNHPDVEKVEITVLGSGSSLIGGTMRTEITRAEALELALDGFLPKCAITDRPNEDKRSVFRELGLPYVSDPAVTRHLAAFLAGAGDVRPDAILFNGGFFIPDILRTRVADVIESWFGKRPIVLENRDLDLAVAVGAAYYANAKTTGTGVLVRGGLPRAYFIGVGESGDRLRTVCLAPRGTEEGASLSLEQEGLQLVANKPVSFRLYSSLTRTEDKLGDVVEFPAEMVESGELHAHAPLNAVIRFGKPQGERLVPVKLGATLSAVGTLEIFCDAKISDNRWRLQFELRKQKTQAKSATSKRAAAVISDEGRQAALALVNSVFAPGGVMAPEELPAKLEQALGLGRLSWPLELIRALADRFMEHAEGRKRSAAHEARWLNLCGLCLRPGFGYPGDDLRIEQARRIYAAGLTFSNQVQCEIEWYIFWGRVAGGLNRNQQADLYQRMAQFLLPKGNKKPQRINASLHREMWRTAASLELLPAGTRTELGDALVRKIRAGEAGPAELWCLSRLGARRLFYGPLNQVLPPSTAGRWAESVSKTKGVAEVLARLAQRTGNVTLDVSAQTMALVKKALENDKDAAELLAIVDGETAGDFDKVFGEELPGGLVLSEPDAVAPQ
jgi:actin-like ATPase involved in cell morphogenesis